jgi:hypothetical protein
LTPASCVAITLAELTVLVSRQLQTASSYLNGRALTGQPDRADVRVTLRFGRVSSELGRCFGTPLATPAADARTFGHVIRASAVKPLTSGESPLLVPWR